MGIYANHEEYIQKEAAFQRAASFFSVKRPIFFIPYLLQKSLYFYNDIGGDQSRVGFDLPFCIIFLHYHGWLAKPSPCSLGAFQQLFQRSGQLLLLSPLT